MQEEIQERGLKVAAIIIAAMGFTIALLYAFATPPLEAPDEIHYYSAIRIVALEHRLPLLSETSAAGHPPLYLILGAIVYKLFIGASLPAKVLALRVFGSIIFSLTIFLIFRLIRVMIPGRPFAALMGALLTALWPQLVFISASVSSDVLLFFLSVASILTAANLKRKNIFSSVPLLILLIAAGFMTKERYIFTLIPIVCIAATDLAILASRRLPQKRKHILAFSSGTSLAILLLLGLRAGMADAKTMAILNLNGPEPFSNIMKFDFLDRMFEEMWGYFGSVQIALPSWIYICLLMLMLVGVIGVVRSVNWIQKSMRLKYFLAASIATIVIVALSMANYDLYGAGSQGRYIFTALAPLVVLMSLGLSEIFQKGMRQYGLMIIGLFLLTANIYGVFFRVLPFYY